MRVPIQRGSGKETESELFAVGNSLAVEMPGLSQGGQMNLLRIGPLSRGQWGLLAEVASDRMSDGESNAERPPMTSQTRFINSGRRVMQGDHCAAVACSSSMAKTIAIALNNRREARSRTKS